MKKLFGTVLTTIAMFFLVSVAPVSASDLQGKLTLTDGIGGLTQFEVTYDGANDITNVKAYITLTDAFINNVLNQAPGSATDKASLGTFYFNMTPTLDNNPTHYNYTNKDFDNSNNIANAKSVVDSMLDAEAGPYPTSATVWPANIRIQYYDASTTTWKTITDKSNGGKTIKANLMEKLGISLDSELKYGENFRFFMNTDRYYVYAFDGYNAAYDVNIDNSANRVSTREFVKVSYEVKFPVTAKIGQKGVFYTSLEAAIASGSTDITINNDITVNTDVTIPENVTVKISNGVTLTVASGVTLENKGTIESAGSIEQDGKAYHNIITKATNGTVTIANLFVKTGDEVTINLTPNNGYKLGKLVVTADGVDITVTDNKFTMPDSDVTISATFVKVETIENPPTFDGILNYAGLGLVGLVGIISVGLYMKKKNN